MEKKYYIFELTGQGIGYEWMNRDLITKPTIKMERVMTEQNFDGFDTEDKAKHHLSTLEKTNLGYVILPVYNK